MLTQIGPRACNALFGESSCEEFSWGYPLAAGALLVAVYERDRIIDFVLNLFSRQAETSSVIVLKDLRTICEKAGHVLSPERELQWNEGYLGDTGYIDGIFARNLPHAAMWGQDNYGRVFAAFRLRWWERDAPENKRIESFVLFQRYVDGTQLAASGRHAPFEWTHQPSITKLNDPQSGFIRFLQGQIVELGGRCFQLDQACEDDVPSSDSCMRIRRTDPPPAPYPNPLDHVYAIPHLQEG